VRVSLRSAGDEGRAAKRHRNYNALEEATNVSSENKTLSNPRLAALAEMAAVRIVISLSALCLVDINSNQL